MKLTELLNVTGAASRVRIYDEMYSTIIFEGAVLMIPFDVPENVEVVSISTELSFMTENPQPVIQIETHGFYLKADNQGDK